MGSMSFLREPRSLIRDRATYDESSSAYVVYSVSQPTDAPSTLTFGPAFIELAATYNGTMVLGLLRFPDSDAQC